MAKPDPLNSLTAFVAFCGVDIKNTGGVEGVFPGSLSREIMLDCLSYARMEIFNRTLFKTNEELLTDTNRYYQLAEAEMWIAKSRVLLLMAHKASSNPVHKIVGGVGDTDTGQESTSVASKYDRDLALSKECYEKGKALIESPSSVFQMATSRTRYPQQSPYYAAYYSHRHYPYD